jgi:hypothetical protein
MKQRLAALAVGGVLFIVGVLFFWEGIPHTSSVTCQRTSKQQIDCLKQGKIFWWIPIQQIRLKELQTVKLAQGENAYDSIVYLVYLRGEYDSLTFGNSLDEEVVQSDIRKAQQFLQNWQERSLTLERYEVEWGFAILGFLIGGMGVWIMIADLSDQQLKP